MLSYGPPPHCSTAGSVAPVVERRLRALASSWELDTATGDWFLAQTTGGCAEWGKAVLVLQDDGEMCSFGVVHQAAFAAWRWNQRERSSSAVALQVTSDIELSKLSNLLPFSG